MRIQQGAIHQQAPSKRHGVSVRVHQLDVCSLPSGNLDGFKGDYSRFAIGIHAPNRGCRQYLQDIEDISGGLVSPLDR